MNTIIILNPALAAYWHGADYTGPDAEFDHNQGPFFNPVVDNPNCAVTRMAYADWLEERGLVQRAERQKFIALEILKEFQ